MSDAAAVPVMLPRPRWQSAGIAAATLWLPCLVGLGIVQGSSHALATYWKLFVVMPGMIVPTLLHLDDFWFGAVAVLTTLVAFAGLYVSVRQMPLLLMRIMITVAAVLVGIEAVGFGQALRA